MKINNINNQQNFKGFNPSKIGGVLAQHPNAAVALAGSSVIMQKIVMSGSEAVIGPAMDIGIGKTITKITNEKDGRTNDSAKKQAVRTFSAAFGGTIVGIIIRALCIAGATALCSKAGGKLAESISYTVKDNFKDNKYINSENAKSWGKSIGGAVAIGIMLFTNFLIDAPLINKINTKVTEINTKFANAKKAKNSETNNDEAKSKEVK